MVFYILGDSLSIFLDYRHGGDFYSLTGSELYRSGSITETLPYRTEDFVPDGVVANGSGGFTPNTQTTTGLTGIDHIGLKITRRPIPMILHF